MTVVSVQDAKAQLSRLLHAVEHGQEVVIARHGRPVARLVPVSEVRRRFGVLSLTVPDDFDEPLPEEELAGWE